VLTVDLLTVKCLTIFSLFYQVYKNYVMAILVVCLRFWIHIQSVCVCVCVCSYCVAFLKVKLDVHIYLKYDKNMEQSLVKLIHFWE